MNIEQSLKTLSSHHDRPPPRLNRNFSMDSPSGEVVHALSFSPLIEGIGNEVLLVLPLLAVILPSLCGAQIDAGGLDEGVRADADRHEAAEPDQHAADLARECAAALRPVRGSVSQLS